MPHRPIGRRARRATIAALCTCVLILAGYASGLAAEAKNKPQAAVSAPSTTTPPARDEALAAFFEQLIGRNMSSRPEADRATAVQCLLFELRSITAAERQMILDSNETPLTDADRTQIEANHPGMLAATQFCQEDALTQIADQILMTEMPTMSDVDRVAILNCELDALYPLTERERQMLVDTRLRPSRAQNTQVEAAHPGLSDKIGVCLSAATYSSTVSMADGRSLTLVTGLGGEHSVSSVNGGYDLNLNGRKITFVNGVLTVDGRSAEIPTYKTTLTIRVTDGRVRVTGD